MFVKIN
jgi:hexosaminidase